MAERTIDQWKVEIDEDLKLIKRYAKDALDPELSEGKDGWGNLMHHRSWAMALKEARRLESDLYRMAEVAGVTRQEIDNVGPL